MSIRSLLGRPQACAHEFNYMRDMTPRNANGMLACPCLKCGALFMAECGLDLMKHGRLVQVDRSTATDGQKGK
jgi:hypothetical protein